MVEDFLNDRLPSVERTPPYIVRPHRRQIVKEKVKKSLEVLETALENHRYVLGMHQTVYTVLLSELTHLFP